MKYNIKTIIDKIEYLADDVIEITFKILGEKLDFKAGQYIEVEISKEPLIVRAYSVLRYDRDNNKLSIAVKRVPNGKGTTIMFNDFKVGMDINISKPQGEELIVDKNKDNLLLVATGIGVTPIFCIINDLVKSNYKGKATFVYGVRREKELYYFNELKSLVSKNNVSIDIIPVISNQDDYSGHKGYVTDIIKHINIHSMKIYLCGSKVVENSLKELLHSKKFNLKNFFSESA